MNPLSQGWTRSVRSVRTPLLAPYSVHRFALWSFLLGLGTRWGQRGLTSAGGVRQGPGTCRHGRLYFSHRFPSDQAPAPALPRPSGVVGEGSVPQRDALSQGRPEEHSTRRSHGGSLARRLHLQEPLPGAWENQNQSLSGHNTAPSDLAGDSSWAPPAQDPDPCVPAEGTWGPCVVWQTEAGDHGRLHRCQEVQWAHPAPAAVPQALLWARPAGQLVRGSAWWWTAWGLCGVRPVPTDQSAGTWNWQECGRRGKRCWRTCWCFPPEDCGKRSQTLCVPSADSSSLQLLPAPSCGAQATAACSALSPACSWEETRTTEL